MASRLGRHRRFDELDKDGAPDYDVSAFDRPVS
jgi:hypothetical protein